MIVPIPQIAKASIIRKFQFSPRVHVLGGRTYITPRRSTSKWRSQASQRSTKTTVDLEESIDESYLLPALPKARELGTRQDRTEYKRQQWTGQLSSSADAVRIALRQGADPSATLRRHLDDAEEIDTHILSLCARELWVSIAKVPRPERATILEPLKEQGLARQILLRILEHRKCWESIVLHETDLCNLLCYLAVNEGLESHIKTWLCAAVSKTEHEGRWRGMLLRGLVFAHLYRQTDFTADAALTCFLDIRERKLAERLDYESTLKGQPGTMKPPLSLCSLSPAIIELRGIISGRVGVPNTNVQLYDRFRDVVRSYYKKETDSDARTIAQLDLYHPAEPREALALALLHKQHKHGIADGSIVNSMSHPSMAESFRRFVHKTIAVAKLNGNTEEANWVQKEYGHYRGYAPLVRRL